MRGKCPIVNVLLATYNSGPYLQIQIDSISSQIGVAVRIHVLDDGSTDETVEILHRLKLEKKIVSLQNAKRIGPSAAFWKLLEDAGESDYYAFSDQDDIWIPTKLLEQIRVMDLDKPMLVFSGRSLIDESGRALRSKESRRISPGLGNALVENIAYGNTQLINSQLRNVILSRKVEPKFIDSWIYLVASYFGRAIRLNRNLVLYRIHSRNTVGLGKRGLKGNLLAIKDYRNQALNFKAAYLDSSKNRSDLVTEFLSAFEKKNPLIRFYLFLRMPIYRQSRAEDLAWKLLACLFGH